MDVRNKLDKIVYLYSMLMVRLQWLPSTQTPNMLREFFARENFLLYLFIYFFHARMDVKLSARQQLEKYAGQRRPQINYRLRLLLFFFNLLQRVCLASLLSASVLFLTRCLSLPTGLPPPAAIAKRGLKTRGEQKHPGWHTHCTSKENRKTHINLQKNSKFNPLFTASC